MVQWIKKQSPTDINYFKSFAGSYPKNAHKYNDLSLCLSHTLPKNWVHTHKMSGEWAQFFTVYLSCFGLALLVIVCKTQPAQSVPVHNPTVSVCSDLVSWGADTVIRHKIPAALPVRGAGCWDYKGSVNEGVITVKVCLHVSHVGSSLLLLLSHRRHLTHCDLLPASLLSLVFLKEGAWIKQSKKKMPAWCSSDSPASWTLLNEGAEEKRKRKIGHVSHNLCSVNFPAPAKTVYRVLRISNLPLLFSNQNPCFTFSSHLSHFLWLMLFGFLFLLSFFCVTSEDALPWGG